MKKIFNSLVFILIAMLSVQTLNAQTVNGNVLYQEDSTKPINNVLVELQNIDDNTVQYQTTGPDGYYEFNDVPNGNYILKGTKSTSGGGVSMEDAQLVLDYIAGIIDFTPVEYLAANVNGNNNINMSDYQLIKNHILHNTPFPVGPWSFETKVFTISNMKEGLPHGIGGTCSGDVGGSFIPTVNNITALPVAQEGSINISKGEPFTTRILTHSDLSITAAGIIINYPSDLLKIESVEFKGVDYEYEIQDGQIRLVWGDVNTEPINFYNGESLVIIHGVSTAAFNNGMNATLTLDGNTCLIDASSRREVKNLSLASPVIKYGDPSLRLSNYPNPFANTTKLSYYTPVSGNVSIEVYNTTGQMVKNISIGHTESGSYEVSLDASQLAKGYYMCKMRIQNGSGELTNTIRLMKAE